MTVQIVKPALVLKDKLVLRAGTHNGMQYSADEVRKLFSVYSQIEKKPKESRSIEETHAFDVHCGDDEDHKDSSGTWVGDAEGVYWDEKDSAIGFHKLNIVDEAFAKKIMYQKQRGKTSFGVSPRLNVLRVGTLAKDILPKNISIVLTPAGGEELMLSEGQEHDGDRELRQDIVQEIALSEIVSLSERGGISEMEGQELLTKVGELIDTKLGAFQKAQAEAKLNAEMEALKKSCEELQKEKAALAAELQKKNEMDKNLQKAPEEKKKEEEMQKTPEEKKKEEEMQKGKKGEEDEEMQKDGKKYKYYGALSARDSLLQNFRLTPDLTLLDATSVNRVAEDIVGAAKVFDSQFTLEQAQKGVEQIQTILANLPGSKKEEKQLMEKIETTLSSSFAGELKGLLQEKITGSGAGAARRKGLVVGDGSGRADATLSEKQNENSTPKSASDIASDITAAFMGALNVK